MHLIRQIMLPVAITLLTACSTSQSVSVATDYDKGTNFTQYHTYDWYQAEPATPHEAQANYDTFADRRIKAALEAGLPGKGLIRSTRRPDVKIAYDISVKQQQQVDPAHSFSPGFGYGYSYWYGYRYNYGFNRFGPGAYSPINTYNVGTVVIDFVDARDNELVWRGVGESVVDPGSVSEEAINQIVNGILAKYPPKAGERASK